MRLSPLHAELFDVHGESPPMGDQLKRGDPIKEKKISPGVGGFKCPKLGLTIKKTTNIWFNHEKKGVKHQTYGEINQWSKKFRSQTSDNMDRWKAEMGRGREKRRVEESRSEKRKSQKKEDADARKGRKVAKHYVFPMICGSGGSKSRLAKAAGAEPAGQMRDEKLHAVVARSTFASQNVQNTPLSDHFWKLRCRKSARRCGAKHICKSKCTKHTIVGPLLEVEMSKKCTPLWREAHFQVKMYKTHQCRTTFGSSDVEKVLTVVARSTFPSQHVQNTPTYRPLLDVQSSFRVAGARDCAPSQKWAKHEGFVALPKTMQAWDIWRGSAKMHFPWQAQYKRHFHRSC